MSSFPFGSAANVHRVFIHAPTFFERLKKEPGMTDENASNIAVVTIGGQEQRFYYTHNATMPQSASDREAVETAMGDAARVWADSRLTLVRVPVKDVVSDNATYDDTKTMPFAKPTYYNFTEENLLRPGSIPEDPSFDAGRSRAADRLALEKYKLP